MQLLREKKCSQPLLRFSSLDCIPLQAADLVAYENFKDAEGKLIGRRRRKTLELLLSSNTYGGSAKTFNAEGIRALRFAIDLPRLISSAAAEC